MRFVRENLFYVILAAVVVIGSGVAIFYYIGSDIGNTLKSRTRVSKQLSDLAKQDLKVNKRAVDEMKERIELLKKANDGDLQACLKFNKEYLPVISLPEGLGSTRPAFPIDPAKWNREGLYFTFIKAYLTQIDLTISPLRQGLEPTSPPTVQEIEAERAKLAEKFTDPVEAAAKASQSVKLHKANAGLLYVGPSALDRYFTVGMTRATDDKIWEAQVNLWVTNEIIQAIIATNQQWLAEQQIPGAPAPKPSVPRSAVKRLTNITINESIAPAKTGIPRRSLTQRETGGQYAVVPYKFTVIMPTRHVRRLCRMLETQNYHTVTNMTMTGVGPTAREGFYYGVEPVMQVVVEGELLLLADWIRPLLPTQVAVHVPPGPGGK